MLWYPELPGSVAPIVVGAAEEGDAGQENHQQQDDDGEGALGVSLRGLAESHDPIADGFDARHGGAAAGEDLRQKPEGDQRRADRQPRWRDDWQGMTMGGDGADRSDGDHQEQGSDKEIGGDEEDGTGVLDATHVD